MSRGERVGGISPYTMHSAAKNSDFVLILGFLSIKGA